MRPVTLFTGLLTAFVLFAAGTVRAETLVIRNETKAPLTLQAASVIKGVLRPQRPILLQPGGFARIVLPGNKLICIYDARLPNRTLFQGTIEASPIDQGFAIQPDKVPGTVTLEPVKLGPAMPGLGGPGMPGPGMPGPGGRPGMPGPGGPRP